MSSENAMIWLVDDSPLEAELSRKVLAASFDIDVFCDPAEMLERFARGARPNLLIVDWHMPAISGLDVCRYVRSIANSVELPILVLTATRDQDDLLRGLAAGANDFVTKPYRAAELTARVATLVGTMQLHQKLGLAESALREEAAVREKFIAILAHDLRQPLNVFTMGAGLVGMDSGAGSRVSQRFASAAARMQRMLDELLDFSKSRHHTGIPIERRPSDLSEVTTRVVAEVRTAHPDRAVTVDVTGNCTGDWDADRVAQIVSNLLGNALEHGARDAPVRVTVDCDEAGVDIAVENCCPPIAPAVLATMFEPFRQGRPSRTGLGLGLYIVRAIARAHGGDVGVESDDSRTRFVAHLSRYSPPNDSSRTLHAAP